MQYGAHLCVVAAQMPAMLQLVLISFAATNHRSLRERCELSLVAERSPVTSERVRLVVPGFDLELVPAAALVGANGSGKSNVLDALAFACRAVYTSQSRWSATQPPPRHPFMTKQGLSKELSIYELTFVADDTVYEYSFSLGSRHVEHESLYSSAAGPRSRTRLFERTTDANGDVRIASGRRLRGPRLAAEQGTRPNSLFLSSAAQNNQATLTPIWEWVVKSFPIADLDNREPRQQYTARQLLDRGPKYHRQIQGFLRSADLGIENVDVQEVPMAREQAELVRTFVSLLDDDSTGHKLDSEAVLTELQVNFSHRGDVGHLPLSAESAGTKTWFEWAAPMVEALSEGTTLGADELDALLNEYLAAEAVSLFQSPATNIHNAQLIFAAQNPGVISMSQLARDQVWVCEKNEQGSTSLTPVTDYKPRREWEVGEAYRRGRFGGLPVIDEGVLKDAALGSPRR